MSFFYHALAFLHGRRKTTDRTVSNLPNSACKARVSTSLIRKGKALHSHILKHDVASANAEGKLTAPLPDLPGQQIHGAQQFAAAFCELDSSLLLILF